MPIVAQGAVLVPPFKLDVRNSTGDFVDPMNLSLTFLDHLGSPVSGFPVVYPGTIVKDGIGQFHYSWTVPSNLPTGTYTAEWDGILLGSPDAAFETFEVVAAGSMSAGGLDLLLVPDDYDAIRGLLGVTTLDVENKDIDLPSFGPQAELDVKRRISNWTTQMADSQQFQILRLATIYRTACLMAESYVRGGTIGLVRPLSTGEGRDWKVAEEDFCARYEYWVAIADQSDSPGEDGADFTIRPLFHSGPTQSRIRHRRAGVRYPQWLGYPPFWTP